MPKGSDLLVRALENEGVDRVFGVPGEENLDVLESLIRGERNGRVSSEWFSRAADESFLVARGAVRLGELSRVAALPAQLAAET